MVIGAPSYGKGTVQSYDSLANVEERPPGNPVGSYKITNFEFYRANGESDNSATTVTLASLANMEVMILSKPGGQSSHAEDFDWRTKRFAVCC